MKLLIIVSFAKSSLGYHCNVPDWNSTTLIAWVDSCQAMPCLDDGLGEFDYFSMKYEDPSDYEDSD